MRTETDTRDVADRSRRLALFVLSPGALLTALGTTGLLRVKSTLPADARVFGCEVDPDRRLITLVLESAEFDPVRDGERIPQILSPLVTPVPEPTFAADGWTLAVGHGSRLHGLLVNDRLAARPDRITERPGSGYESLYHFESRGDALRASECLAELPVTAAVRPTFAGAQPRD